MKTLSSHHWRNLQSGEGNKIWPSTFWIRCPTGVSPRTMPLPTIHKWPPWWHQVKDPPICRRHHVQQDHHEEKRRASAARRPSLRYHLGGKVVHGVPPTEVLKVTSFTEEGQDRTCVWATWTEHWKCQHHQVLGGQHSNNMQWESHIDSITKKASKTLGFIRHNLNIGNKKKKETAYKALVHPLLEYAAPVWDPYTANEIEALEKIQRRAARWVTNRHHQTSCVDSILDQLDWPPLQQCCKKARLEMFYKFHHDLISINSKYLPKPSKSRLSSRNNNNHSSDIPTCTTRYRQMPFFPRTIPEWNKLPQEVVTALECFKSRLASHLWKAN